MSTRVRRLFASFQPKQYDLRLEPDRERMSFSGTLTLTGQKTGRPSQRITLHQRGLKVTKATLTRHDKKGQQTHEVARINHHAKMEEVRLHAASLLYPGAYTITLEFEGKIQPAMHGIYLCHYELDGKKQQLVATQFESTHAREAFPCVDEPEAKATFNLTLVSPAGETALSNMPAKTTSQQGRACVTTFETTPVMSPYLLAFVYGDLHCTEATAKDGVLTRVWATKAQPLSALEFPLEVAKRSIEFFNEYYGVPYPLPKCDHVALPDFSAGAMENWGLITYREVALLADPTTTSQSSREYIASVVCHELSHQWFGDLVTMRWWDDLWLNESFANVMEYVAPDALYPDWQVWNAFTTQEGLSAIRRDSIAGVQAIKMDVHNPEEIDTLFDPSIVYAKGGRLLNMLRTFIGEDAFRKGLKAYFTKHAYSNTAGSDLWAALGAASDTDVAAFMNPWLVQSGFPVVRVAQSGGQITISQSHFLLDPTKADPARRWSVPLLATSSQLPAVLKTASQTVQLASDEYVRINQGAIGHYVVHYSEPAHLAAIAGQAERKELSVAERLMLLSDSGMLARAGVASFVETLKLLNHYEHEDHEAVWDMMSLTLGDARRFIDDAEKLDTRIKSFIRRLIQEQYDRLGWEERPNEAVNDTKLRASILGLGVFARHEDITKRALELFTAYQTQPDVVSGELRGIVFAAAVRNQVAGAFEYLLNLHDTTQNSDLQQDSRGALTTTENSAHIATLLGRLTDASKVRLQDVGFWTASLLRSRHARSAAWGWLRSNWTWLEQNFRQDKSYDYFPRYAASAFNTRTLLEEYRAFFEPKQDQPILARNIAMGIEEIENRVAWLERDLAAVQAFFEHR
ncbi:MAG TPA: M1 family metallopeptidase [Candidatus Saccharimonadales bacterium]|nr:M1 family metallopeptidase [Candidatus Saccharimonadales bacterium]